jgi:hypothetical protein
MPQVCAGRIARRIRRGENARQFLGRIGGAGAAQPQRRGQTGGSGKRGCFQKFAAGEFCFHVKWECERLFTVAQAMQSFFVAGKLNREPRKTRERKFKYAEGVTEISPGLRGTSYPGKSSPILLPLRVRFGSEWGEVSGLIEF